MNKLSVAVFSALISANAAAATFAEGNSVTFGVEGLYHRPVTPEFIFTQVTNTGISKLMFGDIEQDHDWGIHGDIKYSMAGNAPDFTLGWTHFKFDDGENILNMDSPRNAVETATGATTAHAHAEDKYDEVTLVAGKDFTFKNCYHFHPYAGAGYLNFEADDDATYFNSSDVEVAHGDIDNEFDGLGATFGVDSATDISEHFQVVADARTAIYYGEHSFKNVQTGSVQNIHKEEMALVPSFEMRMGLRFNHEMASGNAFGIEAGYDQHHYFDLLDKTNELRTSGNTDRDNWDHEGFYVRLDYKMA